jgi:hypothetical protein
MSLDWMAVQLANTRGGLNLSMPRYNPRPAGVIRPGSATEVALQVLRAAHGQFLTHSQLLTRTGCTQKALSWALIYLKSQQLVETSCDESRNARYLRYRAVAVKECRR